MTTAQTLITGSLRLIGVIADGETPSATMLANALEAFNQMVDAWSTDRLAIYATQDQQFTWPASQQKRTLGPSGNFVGNRPVSVMEETYYIDPGNAMSFPIKLISQANWDAIALKNLTNVYPQMLFINYDMPDITMYVYPIPTKALEWHFISIEELTQPASLATSLTAPPGYLRAFRYNLAVELAPEFGAVPSPLVMKTAATSLKAIKRQNYDKEGMAMEFPAAVMGNKKKSNIFIGGYW